MPLAKLVEATKPLKRLDDRDLNDLALLTLGSTLQGRRNVVLGNTAIVEVFSSIRAVIQPFVNLDTGTVLQFTTPGQASFELRLSSDPDISLDRLLATDIGVPRRAHVYECMDLLVWPAEMRRVRIEHISTISVE